MLFCLLSCTALLFCQLKAFNKLRQFLPLANIHIYYKYYNFLKPGWLIQYYFSLIWQQTHLSDKMQLLDTCYWTVNKSIKT